MKSIDLLAQQGLEWPMLGFMFDTPLFGQYAWSLVRLLEFAALLEPDHPCLLEEARILKNREAALRAHIHSFKSVRLWDEARDTICSKLRQLAVMNLQSRETSCDVEAAVLAEIQDYDFSVVFD